MIQFCQFHCQIYLVLYVLVESPSQADSLIFSSSCGMFRNRLIMVSFADSVGKSLISTHPVVAVVHPQWESILLVLYRHSIQIDRHHGGIEITKYVSFGNTKEECSIYVFCLRLFIFYCVVVTNFRKIRTVISVEIP